MADLVRRDVRSQGDVGSNPTMDSKILDWHKKIKAEEKNWRIITFFETINGDYANIYDLNMAIMSGNTHTCSTY